MPSTLGQTSRVLDHFDFDYIASPQKVGQGFLVVITAKDSSGNVVTDYGGVNSLSVSGNVVIPSSTENFIVGHWSEFVRITQVGNGISISTMSGNGKMGTSNSFNVVADGGSSGPVNPPGSFDWWWIPFVAVFAIIFIVTIVGIATYIRQARDLSSRKTQFVGVGKRGPKSINVLFLAANPTETTQLDLNTEFNAIDDELYKGKFRDRFKLDQRFELKPDELSEQILRHNPQIVHFSGHGSPAGEIILQDETGKARPIDTAAITNLFSVLKEDNIRCVVLNACYSKLQAIRISEYVDCVIGMSKAIGDEAAIKFAQGFYRGLGFGKDLETAFNLGCSQIDLQGLDEEDTPKIIWKGNQPKRIVLIDT